MATRSRGLHDAVAHRKMYVTNAKHIQSRPDPHRVSGRKSNALKVDKLVSIRGPQVGKRISGYAAEAIYGPDWCNHSHEVDELGNLYRRHAQAVIREQMEAHKAKADAAHRKSSVASTTGKMRDVAHHGGGHRLPVMS